MKAVWNDQPHGLSTLTIAKSFLTCSVIKMGNGQCMVRVNGKEVQRSYPDVPQAKAVAIKAAEKLLVDALDTIRGM